MYILKLKEPLLEIRKLNNKHTSNLRNLHTHTHTHVALTFERIYLFRNVMFCSTVNSTSEQINLTVLDLGVQNHLPDGRSS